MPTSVRLILIGRDICRLFMSAEFMVVESLRGLRYALHSLTTGYRHLSYTHTETVMLFALAMAIVSGVCQISELIDSHWVPHPHRASE